MKPTLRWIVFIENQGYYVGLQAKTIFTDDPNASLLFETKYEALTTTEDWGTRKAIKVQVILKEIKK